MITVFNRKELLLTTDATLCARAREILAANAIKYRVKVTGLQSASLFGTRRATTGSFGTNQNYSYEYRIYVLKKDFDNAARLIR